MSKTPPTPSIRASRTIAARILIAIFLISSVATVLVTALELALDYGDGETSLIDHLQHAADSSGASLARALWDLDDAGAKSILGGLTKLADVHGATIVRGTAAELASGTAAKPGDLEVRQAIIHEDGDERRVLGELRLVSRRQAYDLAFLHKSILFIVIRALKSALVSLAIYWVVHKMLTRHLILISRHLEAFSVPSVRSALSLSRKKAHHDELDSLVDSINLMQSRLEHSFAALAELNRTLESRIDEQTRVAMDKQRQLDASARLTALGRIAAGISHEIKNPLAVVMGNARLMTRHLATESVDRKQLLDRAEKCERAADRIDRITTAMSRLLASSPTHPPLEAVALRPVLEDLRELCDLRCRSESIELVVHLPKDDVGVLGSSTQLCQVLLNLASNACDAVVAGQMPKVEVTWTAAGDRVSITVQDNGPGIPPELAARVMEPFFTTKEPGKGVGLGLSLSRSIMEHFGGTLTVTSSPGDTRFTATMPAAKLSRAG